ncbi:hypothetical protein IEQ34_014300 [Dendrobium chrysotoxum]|uniref:Uncharacterized protein n=1 Tax=Dendrobium chrysotoxum TaxID=161865 RepID=A0AAV7GLN2_DENCH|nr:hypothetical protein IEQ34_014300 [Dendrobium chrysotoxum]
MELGRTSFRTNRNNKRGALPLAMVLSFNDKGVHPHCPNISNPYHKCGRHCLDIIPSASGTDFLNAIRPDGDRELEMISEKKGVNPKCPHASNRYHKCAEYCLDKVSEKRPDAGEQQPGMNPKEEKKEVFTTERRVKPACIHASNPYHACAECCFQTVPEKDQPGQSMRLQGPKEGEKVLSTKKKAVIHPQCKHASNPNHECTQSCFQSVTDRNVAEGEKANTTNKSSVHLNRSASSLNKINGDCFEDTPRKKNLRGDMKPKKENELDVTIQRGFTFECKNASNPYHVCVEYCFQSVPEREQHGKVIRVKSVKEGEKVMSNIENTENSKGVSMETDKYVHSSRKHASSPYNKVTEYYCKDTSEKEHPEEVIKPKEKSEVVVIAEQGVNLECESALNPDHVRAEYCFQSAPEKEQHGQEKPKGVSFKIDKSSALPNHKHASNPYHEVIEYCFYDNPKKEHPTGAMKPKEERLVVTAEPGVNLVCKYASNPYHECTEYCIQNLHIKDQSGKALMKSKENKVADPLEIVNPQCKHTSNPYHVCTEYCSQCVSNGHQPGKARMKSKEEKEVVASPQVLSFDCKYASNPYHVCGEYCLENVLEKDPPTQTIKKLKEEELVVLPSERRVSPECKFASNPYHVCAEYCFQKALETEQHLKSLKELKNLVSNKKITSGHTQCEYASNPYHKCAEYCFNKNIHVNQIPDGVVKINERKKEKGHAPRRDDNPKYKTASNSLHKCAEYCPEEISPKNEAVEGSTATIKEKKRNSSKEHKRNHPSVEKISLNSKYMVASKPSHSYIENVQAFNPTNNIFNLNYGISMYMQDGTKDMQMQSEKVVDTNPKELSDMPPAHIDASDLFHEWSKYCSQTMVAEDEIVKQEKKAGMGEFATRNGKGNGFPKDSDSATMEKNFLILIGIYIIKFGIQRETKSLKGEFLPYGDSNLDNLVSKEKKNTPSRRNSFHLDIRTL